MTRRRKMKQLTIFDLSGIAPDKPDPSLQAAIADCANYDPPSNHATDVLMASPLPEAEADDGPIPFEDARILSGDDTIRILQGESRAKVLAERRERNAEAVDHTRIFVNIAEADIRFEFDRCRMTVGRHKSAWFLPEKHEKLDDDVRRVLVPSDFALWCVLDGKIKPTATLVDTLISAGLLEPTSTVHELRPTPAFDDTIQF